MKKAIKFWWWRIWTFRKEKFKITFEREYYVTGTVTSYCGGSILYIGKGYWISGTTGKLKIT